MVFCELVWYDTYELLLVNLSSRLYIISKIVGNPE